MNRMNVSLEEARAGIVRHYKGRGWSEEQIRVDALRTEEVFRIYQCCQQDEEASRHIKHDFAGLLDGTRSLQGQSIEQDELPASIK